MGGKRTFGSGSLRNALTNKAQPIRTRFGVARCLAIRFSNRVAHLAIAGSVRPCLLDGDPYMAGRGRDGSELSPVPLVALERALGRFPHLLRYIILHRVFEG